jgi:hypothetical protein
VPAERWGGEPSYCRVGWGMEGYMPRHDLVTLTCMLALGVWLLAILLAAAAVT